MKNLIAFVTALMLAGAALAHTVLPGDTSPSATPYAAFSLIDQHGQPFTDADLAGQPTAVFFGFTSCPDVCPMTLSNLGELIEAAKADGLRVVMVTVDPANDAPEVMGEYLSAFDPAYIGLTGDQAQLDAAAARFYVTHSKNDGVISHSASIYLLDAQGELQDAIFYTEPAATAVPKIKALMGRQAG